MAVNIIREFTAEDKARVEAAAVRFAARHGIHLYPAGEGMGMAEEQLDAALASRRDLAKLWQAAFCRALRMRPSARITVAHGYVGERV